MASISADPNAWSDIAEGYDDTARKLLTPFSERAVQWAKLGPDDAVLDVAAGPGTTTVLAAELARSVHAIDFAEGMIAALRARTSGKDNVTAAVGDGQTLTEPDGRFTAAFSMFGLMFFPDPIAGLRELHRVLAPGGRAIISSWVPMSSSPMMLPLGKALEHAIGSQPDKEPPPPLPFDSPAALEAGMREGGFVDVEVEAFTPSHPIEGADGFWAGTRGNLFVRHIRKEVGDGWPEVEARALEYLREALAGVTSLEMPGLIAKGVKAR